MKFSKNVNDKKCAPKLILFNEKLFWKDSDNFWHKKLTLKVRNWQFMSAEFGTGKRYENVIFDQWPKLCMGYDVEPEIRILKII